MNNSMYTSYRPVTYNTTIDHRVESRPIFRPATYTEMTSIDLDKSKGKMHKSECTWTIHSWDATPTRSSDMKLTSEIFSSATNDGTKWCLEIHPIMASLEEYMAGYYYPRNVENYVSVYLRLVSVKNGSTARVGFDLCRLSEQNTKITLFGMGPETVNINTNPRIGKSNAFSRSQLNSFQFGNEVKLLCSVVEYTDNADDLDTRRIVVPKCKIIDDYNVLFETKALSDVKIIAKGNVEFEAHRAILAVRSSVFAAMFKHEMKERTNNCIEIMDTDPKVLEEMLRFVYTGKVNDINEMAMDLLVAADKYDLQRLKIMCEEKLCATLNVENAAQIFTIADRHSCKQLKTVTGSFIRDHVKDVMKTKGYSSMIKSHPSFAEQLLHEIFS